MHIPGPRKRSAINAIELAAIRQRVQAMCERVTNPDVRLADLFSMIGEDDHNIFHAASAVRELEVERVRPDDVPTINTWLTYGNGRTLTEA